LPYHDFRQFLDVLRQHGELIDVSRPAALNDCRQGDEAKLRAAGPPLLDLLLLAKILSGAFARVPVARLKALTLSFAAANPPRSGTVSRSQTMTVGFMQIAAH
jgi:hypothetical protein